MISRECITNLFLPIKLDQDLALWNRSVFKVRFGAGRTLNTTGISSTRGLHLFVVHLLQATILYLALLLQSFSTIGHIGWASSSRPRPRGICRWAPQARAYTAWRRYWRPVLPPPHFAVILRYLSVLTCITWHDLLGSIHDRVPFSRADRPFIVLRGCCVQVKAKMGLKPPYFRSAVMTPSRDILCPCLSQEALSVVRLQVLPVLA